MPNLSGLNYFFIGNRSPHTEGLPQHSYDSSTCDYLDLFFLPNLAMAVQDDFVMTIDSDAEDLPPPPPIKQAKGKQKVVDDDAQLNPNFTFDVSGDPYSDLLDGPDTVKDLVKSGTKPVSRPPIIA